MSSRVTARFYVASTELTASASQPGQPQSHATKVILYPVTRPTNDNIQWSKYTPSGNITMTITDEGAQKTFEEALGKDVAITFEVIEPDAPDAPKTGDAATGAID